MVRFLILIILGIKGIDVCSQTLRGKVVDSLNRPINGVVLTIRDSITQKTIGFGFSDVYGLFSISMSYSCNACLLHVTHLSYKEKLIDKKGKWEEFLSITLFSKITTLQEVVIKSDIPITINGDTTTYIAERFIKPEDRKLKDLFSNMPGFIVDPNGRLSYKGKIVEKLFIEGDDPGGSNYGLITQNMSLNGISKIDVIDNFDDNRLLKNVRKSDKVAVNIQMKEEYRMRLSGSGAIGLSTGKQRYGDLNTTLLGKKVKQLNFLTGNNTGEGLSENFNGSVYKSNEDIVSELSTNNNMNDVSAGGVSAPGIDNRLTLQNNDLGAATLMSWRIGKSIKMNGQFGLRETNKNIFKQESSFFNITGLDRWERISDQRQFENGRLFFSTLSFKHDNGGKSLSDGFLMLKKEQGNISYYNSVIGTITDSMSEFLGSNNWKYNANWTKSMLIGKKVLRIGFESSLNDGSQGLSINSIRLQNFFNLDSSYLNYFQRSNKRIHINTLEIKLNEKKEKSFLEVGIHFNNVSLGSTYRQHSIKGFERILGSDTLNANLISGLIYGRKGFILAPKLSLSVKAVLGIGRLHLNNSVHPLPDIKTIVTLRKIFSKKSTLTLSHQVEKSFSEWDNLVPNSILNSNASIQQNLIFSGVSESQKVSGVFSSNNILAQRFFLFQTSYTFYKHQYGFSSWQYPEYSITSLERFRNSRVFNIVSSQRIYIHILRTSLNLGVHWMDGNRLIRLNGVLIQQSNRLGNLSLELKTGFQMPINFSVTGLLNYSAFSWGSGTRISNYQSGFHGKVSYKLSKNAYMASRWRWDQLTPKNGFHSIDYYFIWKLNKFFDIKCEAFNLLNASVVSTRTLNEFGEQVSSYQITRRFFLFTGSFNF